MDDDNTTTTKLLTLLNVSALKLGKKKHLLDDLNPTINLKLNRRKHAVDDDKNMNKSIAGSVDLSAEEKDLGRENIDDIDESTHNSYEAHFGIVELKSNEQARSSVDEERWKHIEKKSSMGVLLEYMPQESNNDTIGTHKYKIVKQIESEFLQHQANLPKELVEFQIDYLQVLGSYKDVFITRADLQKQSALRDATCVHVLNHILNKRRYILKNNERLSKNPSNDNQLLLQDQGFTRPSVLILLPFRSFALRWLNAVIALIPKSTYQIENHSRFVSEYSLPPGTVDKLETAPVGSYPLDHIEMFRGNIDDSFRIGIKATRKSIKLFSDFYQCDLIVASPLGLRMSIEKEKNADFLSSVEIVVVDQIDALTMQNWEHVQYVFSNLNQIPKETRDTDFSRIRPWYLDGLAKYFRQTILLSPFDTPEMRSLFNSTLKNISGKIRTLQLWPPVQIPEGVPQTFLYFECSSHKAEADKRFEYFSTKLLPSLLKSAVQSTNTVIFIPSSFDFIRVQNHFRKTAEVSFAVLSEYSTNQDISRARQAFFSGNKSFLLVSERFHFFRRYKIRGIRNFLFYGLPDHAQFYADFLSYPFLDEGVEPSDVTCRVLYCKYDRMKLERVAGTTETSRLLKANSNNS